MRTCLRLTIHSLLASLTILTATPAGASQNRAEENCIQVVIHEGPRGLSTEVRALVNTAIPQIQQVLCSEQFKSSVLNFKRFEWNEGLSNQQIYDKIMAGVELTFPGFPPTHADQPSMEIWVSDYWSPRGVVGWTSPQTPIISLNRYWYRRMSVAEVAANLVHEWTHKLGFDHSFERTPERDSTVPYAIGSIVEAQLRTSEQN